jgi:hypothetical protein
MEKERKKRGRREEGGDPSSPIPLLNNDNRIMGEDNEWKIGSTK